MPGAPGNSNVGPDGRSGADGPPGGGQRAGGLLNGAKPSERIEALLETDADSYTWVAAAIGANSAAGFQLATELPVMPLGGFNGTDPSPTLAQFQQYVRDGKIHYFVAGGGIMGRSGGAESAASDISAWVAATFTPNTVDGITLYDLTT